MPFARMNRLRPRAGRNLLHNTEMKGVIPGTQAGVPRGWNSYFPHAANGVSIDFLPTTYENGMARLNWRVWGTPTVDGGSSLFFTAYPSDIVAKVGDRFALSAFIKRVDGAQPTYVTLAINEVDAGLNYLGNTFIPLIPGTGELIRHREKLITEVGQAGVAKIEPNITVGYSNGVPFDITLGLSIPQLERGQVVTQPERKPAF